MRLLTLLAVLFLGGSAHAFTFKCDPLIIGGTGTLPRVDANANGWVVIWYCPSKYAVVDTGALGFWSENPSMSWVPKLSNFLRGDRAGYDELQNALSCQRSDSSCDTQYAELYPLYDSLKARTTPAVPTWTVQQGKTPKGTPLTSRPFYAMLDQTHRNPTVVGRVATGVRCNCKTFQEEALLTYCGVAGNTDLNTNKPIAFANGNDWATSYVALCEHLPAPTGSVILP